MNYISANFTVEDMTRSQTAARLGIRNVPNAKQLEAMQYLAEKVLEPVLKKFPHLAISSGFRSAALNEAIPGSSKTSQHSKGQAADIEAPGIPNRVLADWIVANCDFDQVILEFHNPADPASGWVHVSYVSPEKNRRNTLTAARDKRTGKVIYTTGFPKIRKAA